MTEHFQVVIPPVFLDRLRSWAAKARAAGCGPEFVDALKLMRKRLETEPVSWGDPLFTYPVMGGVQCRGMIAGWFFVWYGLHVPSRSIVVREIAFAPGCPIE